jgi:hypothetical protein
MRVSGTRTCDTASALSSSMMAHSMRVSSTGESSRERGLSRGQTSPLTSESLETIRYVGQVISKCATDDAIMDKFLIISCMDWERSSGLMVASIPVTIKTAVEKATGSLIGKIIACLKVIGKKENSTGRDHTCYWTAWKSMVSGIGGSVLDGSRGRPSSRGSES